MSRARNAVIIIILCIIGAYTLKKGPQLALNMPSADAIKDAVAGGPSSRKGNPLTLASGTGEDLRDAVAGHAVGTPNNGNTLGDVAPPPRGNGTGGIGSLSNNPGQNFTPPPNLSQSGPTSENNPSDEGGPNGDNCNHVGEGCNANEHAHGDRP